MTAITVNKSAPTRAPQQPQTAGREGSQPVANSNGRGVGPDGNEPRRKSVRLSVGGGGGGKSARPSLASSGESSAWSGRELTVCDIIGEWGRYQWSLCLFAALYSAMASNVVMFGPMFTPDMGHICAPEPPSGLGSSVANSSTSAAAINTLPPTRFHLRKPEVAPDKRECFVSTGAPPDLKPAPVLDADGLIAVKCASFLYNDLGHGLMFTNGVSRRTPGSRPLCGAGVRSKPVPRTAARSYPDAEGSASPRRGQR